MNPYQDDVAAQFLVGRQLNRREGLDDIEGVKALLTSPTKLETYRYDGGELLFRGQSNGRYGLTSSLYRSVQREIDKVEDSEAGALNGVEKKARAEKMLFEAEKRVLAVAKENGIGRGLTSIETLALLQHHLAPTRLLDVSTSALVSLFFTVERHDSLPGRLFLISIPAPRDGDSPLSSGEEVPWAPFVENRLNTPRATWSTKVWHLDTDPLDSRMRAQQGTFLVGGLASNSGDNQQHWRRSDVGRGGPLSITDYRKVSTLSINFPADSDTPSANPSWSASGWSLEIPAAWKAELRTWLREEHGIDEDSIYPPVDEVRRLLVHVAEESSRATLAEMTR